MSSGTRLYFSSDSRTSNSVGTDDFVIRYSPPLRLGRDKYEIALESYNMYNTWPNISADYGNHYFDYSPDGVTWKTITFPDGTYNAEAVEQEINNQVTAYGDDPTKFNFVPSYVTSKYTLEITAPYEVDLGTGSTFYEIVGFSLAQIAAPITVTTLADNIADINRGVNNIYLHCSLVDTQGSYDSGIGTDILSDLAFIGRSPGENILGVSSYLMFVPMVNAEYITEVRLRVSDQLNRRYNLRGQPVSVRVAIRPMAKEDTLTSYQSFGETMEDKQQVSGSGNRRGRR